MSLLLLLRPHGTSSPVVHHRAMNTATPGAERRRPTVAAEARTATPTR